MMDRGRSRSCGVAEWRGALLVVLLSALAAGCGYMPRTANQMQGNLDARDEALRQEMCGNKEELEARLQQADQRLAALDGKVADLERTLEEMKTLEVTMESVRADMTAVRDDIRKVREDLKASVRRELGEALTDAGRSLQTGP